MHFVLCTGPKELNRETNRGKLINIVGTAEALYWRERFCPFTVSKCVYALFATMSVFARGASSGAIIVLLRDGTTVECASITTSPEAAAASTAKDYIIHL